MPGRRGPLKLVTADTPDDELSAADVVTGGEPVEPEGMPDGERDLWRQLVPLLDAEGLVAPFDGLTIDLALRHYLAAVQASDELADAEAVALEDPDHKGRLRKHPADAVMRMHSAMYLQYATTLGLSFAARARLSTRGKASGDGDEGNPFIPPSSSTGGS